MHDDYRRFFLDVGINPHIVSRLQSIYSYGEELRVTMNRLLKELKRHVRRAMHPDNSHDKTIKDKLNEEFIQYTRRFEWMEAQWELFLSGLAPATRYSDAENTDDVTVESASTGTAPPQLSEMDRKLLIQWAQKQRGKVAAYAFAIIQISTGKSYQVVADEFGLDEKKLRHKTELYLESPTLFNLDDLDSPTLSWMDI